MAKRGRIRRKGEGASQPGTLSIQFSRSPFITFNDPQGLFFVAKTLALHLELVASPTGALQPGKNPRGALMRSILVVCSTLLSHPCSHNILPGTPYPFALRIWGIQDSSFEERGGVLVRTGVITWNIRRWEKSRSWPDAR